MSKLFFAHLPKAGGTSVSAALATRFDPSCISPNIENDIQGHQLNDGQYERYRGYDFYSGHYGMDVFTAVRDGHDLIANFRHPVARVYSLYRFFREVKVGEADLSRRHYNAVRAAKSSSLMDFVRNKDDVLVTYISNQQTRQLTGSPWELRDDVDLNLAMDVVGGMKVLYVCEEPGKSLAWFSRSLQIDDIPVLNVTGMPALPEEISTAAEMILDRNEMDLKLYEYALSRLHAQ